MKKTLCLILTLTMFISVIYPCQSVIAGEVGKENALAVGNEVAEMCADYDDIAEFDADEDKKIGTRLIVKTNDNIDEYGAIDSVYGLGYAFLQYADEKSAENAKKQYENSGYTVEYDYIITPASTNIVTGSNKNTEWAYEETDAAAAIDYYKSRIKPDIDIAVMDSGINYNHELFKNRVVRTNADFSSDAANDEIDIYGHGTYVSGAIAKSTPDNVKLSAYKIFNGSGNGTSVMALTAFEYIKQLSDKPDVINCSFTTTYLGPVVDELVNMGVTIVASAGNDGVEVKDPPAIYDNVITVGATNRYFNAWNSSNRGECVDISAPGVDVYTADKSGNYAYRFVTGTSLAAPLVSAAAAYVLMENRNYTPEQVKQKIMAAAMPFKKNSWYYYQFGAGILNISNIINGTRCKDVTANYISGAYRDGITLELNCEDSLVDIYYTTDGTMPTVTKGKKYTGPINLTNSTRIIAAAFAREGTTLHSKFTCLDYYILEEGENEFVIEQSGNSGIIKAYLGNETNVVIPDIVNGIEPTDIGENVFKNSNIESIVLPDTVVTIGENAFKNCHNLENIYAPKVTGLGSNFEGCTNLKMIFAPEVQEFTASIPSNATVYCSDKLTTARFPNEYVDYKCTFVSPEYTPGLSIANSEGYGDRFIHINSDKIAKSRGGQIRMSDNGLRFGFALDENDIGFDFKKYAQNIEYGFVYTYDSFEGQSDDQINEKLRVNNDTTNHVKTADKRSVDGTVSTYNLVFTGIPSSNYADEVSARAYICIDGMYFYSPVTTRSFSGVANAVLNDDTISQDIKDKLNELLKGGA